MALVSQLFSEMDGRKLNHIDHDNQTLDLRYILNLILSGAINTSNVYTGTTTPDPTQYSFWYDNSDGTFYFYDTSTAAWITNSNLVGPAGPQGPQGIQGATGPQGVQGPAGPTSSTAIASGASYTNDAAAAAAGVNVGQFYRNGSQLMIRVS